MNAVNTQYVLNNYQQHTILLKPNFQLLRSVCLIEYPENGDEWFLSVLPPIEIC